MAVRIIRNWWWVDFRHEGRRYRIRSPENSRTGAKAYEAVVRVRLTKGEPLRPPKPEPVERFEVFARKWFDTYVRTNNKPSSQRSRDQILRNHLLPFFGSTPLTRLSTAQVDHYKADKIRGGLSPKTVNEHLGVLTKCLRDAREWGEAVGGPTIRRLRAPKPSFRFLCREDAEQLLAAFQDDRWSAMATVALHTGLRLGELFGLRREDVDFTRRSLAVRQNIVAGIVGTPKSNRERHIPLDRQAFAALASMDGPHDLVFHRGDGRPLAMSTAEGALQRTCARASLPKIGWHVLRHTYASWLATAGVPIPAIQQLLGHSTIEMTMRYAHLAPSSSRQAIDALEQYSSASIPPSWAPGGQRPPIAPDPSPLLSAVTLAEVGAAQTKTTSADRDRSWCG